MVTDYTGYLLAAHPLRQNNYLKQGVIFVVDHCDQRGTFGLQINHTMNNGISFVNVMDQLGFPTDCVDSDIPIYQGGNANLNRIYVLHSDDWFSRTTIKYGSKINLTNDLSVLSAISQGQGPKQFRAIAGNCVWNKGELEDQIINLDQNSQYDSWTYTISNEKLVFEKDGRNQWNSVVNSASELQVSRWFA